MLTLSNPEESWAEFKISEKYEGQVYIVVISNEGKGIFYSLENGNLTDITPEGTWQGFDFDNGPGSELLVLGLDKENDWFFLWPENGGWKKTKFLLPVDELESFGYYGKDKSKAYLSFNSNLYKLENDHLVLINPEGLSHFRLVGRYENKSLFTCQSAEHLHLYEFQAGSWQDITPDWEWDGVKFLGEHGNKVYLSMTQNIDEQVRQYLYQLKDSQLSDITPAGEWALIEWQHASKGQIFFNFLVKQGPFSVKLYLRDNNNRWHAISPKDTAWRKITILGEHEGKVACLFNPVDSEQDLLLRAYDCRTPANEASQSWQNLMPSWKRIQFLVNPKGKSYYKFEHGNRLAAFYERHGTVLKWVSPSEDMETSNAPLLAKNEQKQNEQGDMDNPDGNWKNRLFIERQGSKEFYRFQDAQSNSWHLYQYSDSHWQALMTEENGWDSIAFVGAVNGEALFSFYNRRTGIDLFVQQESSPLLHRLTLQADFGMWTHVAFLGEQEGQGYYRFRNEARNHYLYARKGGGWEMITPDGAWNDIILLGTHQSKVLFAFRDQEDHSHLFQENEERLSAITPDGAWRNIKLLENADDMTTFAIEDESNHFHLYIRR